MNKGKRYKSKEEIEWAIDQLRTRAKDYFRQAEANKSAAIVKFRAGHASDGRALVDLAYNRRRRAMGILENKLPKLGEKMAEFLTYQLPGVDNGDKSIPA